MKSIKLIFHILVLIAAFCFSTNAISSNSVIGSFYHLELVGLDGQLIPKESYKNKVVLLVNTASKCGYTPQYANLQQLHEQYQSRGLVVLGMPSGDFGSQEFKQPNQVRHFTTKNFKVTFTLLDIANVKGEDKHPFYEWVEQTLGSSELPKWNFHKYLINRQGQLIGSFTSDESPMSSKIINAIEQALVED